MYIFECDWGSSPTSLFLPKQFEQTEGKGFPSVSLKSSKNSHHMICLRKQSWGMKFSK